MEAVNTKNRINYISGMKAYMLEYVEKIRAYNVYNIKELNNFRGCRMFLVRKSLRHKLSIGAFTINFRFHLKKLGGML